MKKIWYTYLEINFYWGVNKQIPTQHNYLHVHTTYVLLEHIFFAYVC